FIFEFVSRLFRYMTPIDFLVIPSGPVAALVGVALGLLSPPGLEGLKNLPTRGNRDPNRSRLVLCGSMDLFCCWKRNNYGSVLAVRGSGVIPPERIPAASVLRISFSRWVLLLQAHVSNYRTKV